MALTLHGLSGNIRVESQERRLVIEHSRGEWVELSFEEVRDGWIMPADNQHPGHIQLNPEGSDPLPVSRAEAGEDPRCVIFAQESNEDFALLAAVLRLKESPAVATAERRRTRTRGAPMRESSRDWKDPEQDESGGESERECGPSERLMPQPIPPSAPGPESARRAWVATNVLILLRVIWPAWGLLLLSRELEWWALSELSWNLLLSGAGLLTTSASIGGIIVLVWWGSWRRNELAARGVRGWRSESLVGADGRAGTYLAFGDVAAGELEAVVSAMNENDPAWKRHPAPQSARWNRWVWAFVGVGILGLFPHSTGIEIAQGVGSIVVGWVLFGTGQRLIATCQR